MRMSWLLKLILKEDNSPFKIIWAFILETHHASVWTNLGKHLLFVWLFSSIKTDTGRIMRLDELSFVVRLERLAQ